MPNINRCFFTIPVASGGRGGRIFFRKPPAVHRPLFMPPFAGDIGARKGSLKWTAQIPRKAYRWALRGDLKNCFLALNVGDQELEELFLMSSQNTNSECSSVSSRIPENRAKKMSSPGVVCDLLL